MTTLVAEELMTGFEEIKPGLVGVPGLSEEVEQATTRDQVAAVNDRVEEQTIATDVLAADQERRFTHADLQRRSPFDARHLGAGVLILSDRILTEREREDRAAEAAAVRELIMQAVSIPGEDGPQTAEEAENLELDFSVGTMSARHRAEAELLARGYTDHAAHVAALVLSEFCGNVSKHGQDKNDPVTAGHCNVYHFPGDDGQPGYAYVMTTNGSPRPRRPKDYDKRAVQTGGRGLSEIVGFVGEENVGRCRAELDENGIPARFHDSLLSDIQTFGNMTHYVRIEQDLIDHTAAEAEARAAEMSEDDILSQFKDFDF